MGWEGGKWKVGRNDGMKGRRTSARKHREKATEIDERNQITIRDVTPRQTGYDG